MSAFNLKLFDAITVSWTGGWKAEMDLLLSILGDEDLKNSLKPRMLPPLVAAHSRGQKALRGLLSEVGFDARTSSSWAETAGRKNAGGSGGNTEDLNVEIRFSCPDRSGLHAR